MAPEFHRVGAAGDKAKAPAAFAGCTASGEFHPALKRTFLKVSIPRRAGFVKRGGAFCRRNEQSYRNDASRAAPPAADERMAFFEVGNDCEVMVYLICKDLKKAEHKMLNHS